MQILCPGVTGFEPAPSVDSDDFKKTMMSIYRSRVVDFSPSTPGRNYHMCTFITEEDKIRILLNARYPFLAFSKIDSLEFIEGLDLAGMLGEHYRILGQDELSVPLRFKNKGKNFAITNENTLHQSDLQQIAYWKPSTVGEVVFNNWD
ncbi:hypothetical protein AM500_06695 [Bacillus sp. FJAT-18017]|uniref:hypothetical protein n=1 Tax=Bacillus sp. FJAT-18017 TaxID=1705566 RepID=UPI0006AF69B8|nr:hypothetical protein [Bacillus sp. FJAT-18017]ALC89506.1 hypothetical protein AM500_06695 [Bacillus sp. FJAT-18017]